MALRIRLTWLLWSLVLLDAFHEIAYAAPPRINLPDSNELYSYISPRTIQDLKNEHMRQAMLDVSDTITEVQNILQQDPSLPRLTRGEIEDLFEMVAREEYKRSLQSGDFDRARHMRSLMLVLPYNTNSFSEERLEDLYTRAPVTKIINSETKKPKPQQIVLPASVENSQEDMTGAYSDVNSQRVVTTFKPNFNTNVKSTYAAPITTFHPKSKSEVKQTVQPSVSTYHPRVTNLDDERPTGTSTVDYVESHKTNDKFSSHYNQREKVFVPNSTPVMRKNVKDLLATIGLQPETVQVQVPISTTPRAISTTSITTTTSTTKKPELTPELKDLLESFGLLTNEEPPAHLTVGPYQDEFQPIVPSARKDESLHVNDFKPLPPLPVSLTSRADVDQPDESSASEAQSDDFSSFKPLPIPEDEVSSTDDELKSLLKTYGLLEDYQARNKKSMFNDNADELDMMASSGAPVIQAITTTTPQPETTPKMLKVPEVNVHFLSPKLMRVLDDLGIANDASKEQLKSKTDFETTTVDDVSPETSTEGDYEKLHHLLDTIKQLDKLNANLSETELDSLDLNNFNFSTELLAQGPDPLEDLYNYHDERKNEVKRQVNVSESTESPEPIKFTLDILATTPSSTSASPDDIDDDPLKLDDQDEADSKKTLDVDDTDTAADEDSASPSSSTTEESRNGSIKDLADSFGGDGIDPVTEEPLPAPKRNGFYFFSDWNSFLEVGEEPDQVVVRFDPKVGDPRPFIPVKIP